MFWAHGSFPLGYWSFVPLPAPFIGVWLMIKLFRLCGFSALQRYSFQLTTVLLLNGAAGPVGELAIMCGC